MLEAEIKHSRAQEARPKRTVLGMRLPLRDSGGGGGQTPRTPTDGEEWDLVKEEPSATRGQQRQQQGPSPRQQGQQQQQKEQQSPRQQQEQQAPKGSPRP